MAVGRGAVAYSMIFALAWAVRRFGPGSRLLPNAGRDRRLTILEVASVDARRRLILLRRDRTEYLVLLGPTQDLLLDKDFQSAPEEEPAAAAEPPGDPKELSLVTGGVTGGGPA